MSFSQQNGYVPVGFQTIMNSIMNNLNTIYGYNYTQATFQGTNFYKYYYALVQRVQENEVKTAEVFLKLQQFISLTNEKISRPVGTGPGLVDFFRDNGFVASLKPMIEADAGKIHICVDLFDFLPDGVTPNPDYPADKLAVCLLIQRATAIGAVTIGDQVEALPLSNGQTFDYKFVLPDRIETLLRLTVTLSENNQVSIDTIDDQKLKLLNNISERYALGKNFEPQKYFSLVDAPWASQVLLEYSIDDGDNWLTEVFDADYDELLDVSLANTTLVEV